MEYSRTWTEMDTDMDADSKNELEIILLTTITNNLNTHDKIKGNLNIIHKGFSSAWGGQVQKLSSPPPPNNFGIMSTSSH